MNILRLEFENLQKSKYNGTELMFETSNNKYIEWLEQRIVKNCDIPPVSESLPIRYCQQCGEPLRRNKHKTWCERYDSNVR